MKVTWKQLIRRLIIDFCEAQGERTFTLREFDTFAQKPMERAFPNSNTRSDSLRRTLQELREEGLLSFVNWRGTYTWRGTFLLSGEVEAEALPLVQGFVGIPQKREYLIEVYARDQGWVRKARQAFGLHCLCEGCTNSFVKTDGSPYCEVHHIIPFCEGGEEGLWNLSVLCAHHHRMAHFAREQERRELSAFLMRKTNQILQARER